MSLKSHVDEMMNEFVTQDQHNEKLMEWIDGMDEDELKKTLKAINPYGPTLPVPTTDVETVSVSYTNMRMEYTKKLVTTTMIAFIMKMLKEYKVPEEVVAVDPHDYVLDPTIADTPGYVKDKTLADKWQVNRETMPERVVIWEFFKSVFDFDPDRHVASSLQTNIKDEKRRTPDTPATRRAVVAKRNAIRAVKPAAYEAKLADLDRTPLTGVTASAFTIIPPADVFAKYDRYAEEHHEELQDATYRVYGARADVDLCLCVYDKHDTKEDAKKFKDKYMDQVIAPITNIQKNRWVILGPYRENREAVDYMNRHTEILQEMISQRERDSHLATDIMHKRIKTKKKANIDECGPDDEDFKNYIKANKPEISRMGGQHVEQDAEKDECPDDAVEVNVFTVGDGGTTMKVNKIYNKSDLPVDGNDDVLRKDHSELVRDAANLVLSTI